MQPPVPKNDSLVIRTMKDDMNQEILAPSIQATTENKPKKQEKRVETTPPEVLHKHTVLIGIGYIVLFGFLAAAGWYGYVWVSSRQLTPTQGSQRRLVEEMIPKEALAIVAYTTDTDSRRADIRTLWETKGIEDPSTISDPRGLLAIQDVQGVYYIVLQDVEQPFLLLEKTTSSEQYVSTQSAIVPYEKDGWYIFHQGATSATDQYIAALDRGTFAQSGGLPTGNSSSVAQVILATPYALALLGDIAGDLSGTPEMPALVFSVHPSSQGSTIRAHAAVPIPSMPERVLPSTAELAALVPGDVQFTSIGFNFAEDIAMWQQQTARLDATVLQQPAVRQFISLLTTPYAIFKRTGPDGVQDTGLIIGLPEELQKNLKTGEPIIEQTLPAFIPLVVGKSIGIQSAFHNGLYQNVPLRYINIVGQTQTIDYAVGDSFLLVSSSREGMEKLVDRALGETSAEQKQDIWRSEGKKVTFGSVQDPSFKALLPIPDATETVSITISEDITSTDRMFNATILLQQ